MTTRNIVPRANGEGQLGRSDKKWNKVVTNTVETGIVEATGNITAAGVEATGNIVAAGVEATGNIVAAGVVRSGGQELATKAEVDALASGAPAGVYATVEALTAAVTTDAGKAKIYLVSADGKWYYWNGSAWTGGGVYQAAGIADESITLKKLAFTPASGKIGYNLIDTNDLFSGYIDPTTGANEENSDYRCTGYIKIPTGATKLVGRKLWNNRVNFYDATKAFISTTTDGSVPVNALYCKVTFLLADIYTATLCTDGVFYKYTDARPYLDETKILNLPVDAIKEKVATLTHGKNLLEMASLIPNKYIDLDTYEEVSLTGPWTTTPFIEAEASTIYKFQWDAACLYQNAVILYNSDKKVTGIVTVANSEFATGADTTYIRTSVNTDHTQYIALQKSAESAVIYSGTPQYTEDIAPPYAILLPSTIYLRTNENFSLFFRGFIKNYYGFVSDKNNGVVVLQKDGSNYIGIGRCFNDKWDYTPTSVGSATLEIRLVNAARNKVYVKKQITLVISEGGTSTKKVLLIGDSFMDLYHIPLHIKNMLAGKNIVFLGQNDRGDGVRHNCWAGYDWSWLATADRGYLREDRPLSDAYWDTGWGESEVNGWTTGQTYADLTETQRAHGQTKNEMYDPTESAFSLNYYMSIYESGQMLDVIVFEHGLNCLGSALDISDVSLSAIKTQITSIIAACKAHNANIKIVLHTITPMANDSNAIIYAYKNQTKQVKQQTIEKYNEMLLQNFSDDANVIILPSSANFNPILGQGMTGFQREKFDSSIIENISTNIHPSEIGAKYIADSIANILCYLTE